jgi:hypothetical protein
MTSVWRDIDFRPAPPGWRVIEIGDDGWNALPLAGWVIQELAREGREPSYDDLALDMPAEDRPRRVAPAVHENAWLLSELDPDVWVFGPGQPDPTDAEIAAERTLRAQDAIRHAEFLAAKKAARP